MTHKGFTLWLTGMSGAGKSTVSDRLMERFRAADAKVELLDGDVVRTNLSQGLGFSREDRDTNIRRIGFVSELLSRNGVIVVVAAISPYRQTREEVKSRIANFVEVFVDCPIEVLASRDVKGLYKKALAGEVGNFTGISDPYEPPTNPDVTIRSDRETIEDSVEKVWRELEQRGIDSKRMIDLHSHTDQSDGTFTPDELVAEAARIGLHALAITDHDTFAGYDLALPIAAAAGLELVCGIELSTKFGGASIHLLAYFPVQPPTNEFREWLSFLLESRRDRNRRLAERLQSLGLDITLEEVERKGRSLTGRPHFARLLVEKGYAHDIQDAFDKFLDESAQGYVQRQEVPIEEAIDRVVKAGGIASLAHPVRVAKNNWDKLAEYVEAFAAMGIGAVEVFHSDHSPENVAYYKSLAERFGLAVTGGSDFHGANKPLISLGTGQRNNLAVPDETLAGLRRAVR